MRASILPNSRCRRTVSVWCSTSFLRRHGIEHGAATTTGYFEHGKCHRETAFQVGDHDPKQAPHVLWVEPGRSDADIEDELEGMIAATAPRRAQCCDGMLPARYVRRTDVRAPQQAMRSADETREPCQGPAMPNGCCRLHGGMSPGAPKGNRNAYKHGLYTAESSAGVNHGIVASSQGTDKARRVSGPLGSNAGA